MHVSLLARLLINCDMAMTHKKVNKKRQALWRGVSWVLALVSLISALSQVMTVYGRSVVGFFGLHVGHIDVVGKKRTPDSAVLWGVHMGKKDTIWSECPARIQKRLVSLPWVRHAIVSRRIGQGVRIVLVEHQPVAIWHHRSKRYVLDKDGVVVHGVQWPQTESIRPLHVAGDHAPEHMPELYDAIEGLVSTTDIKLALFLRSGRWDVYLKDGRLVKLPETGVRHAMEKWQTIQGQLRHGAIIDLRFPNTVLYHDKPGTAHQ